MKRCDIPLTEEQKQIAEQHIDVVDKFMRSKRLDEDYWDVVIFGYLNAIRNYCERRELRDQYDFNAIACVSMKSALYADWRKFHYYVAVLSLDAPIDGYENLMWKDCVIASYDEDFTEPDVEAILSLLEADERDIVRYLYLGYTREEAARLLKISVARFDKQLAIIRAKLARYCPEASVSA